MKLVRFKNGKFGVRKSTIFGHYFLSENGNWWPKSRVTDFTLEHSEERAKELFRALTDMGEPL